MEFVRFLIAGGSCFILELAILFSATEYLELHYLTSSAIAFSISVAVNYFLCSEWVFAGTKNRSLRTKIIFVATSLIGLGINQICMWIFVEKFSFHYMWAKVISTAIVTLWNFFTKKLALKSSI